SVLISFIILLVFLPHEGRMSASERQNRFLKSTQLLQGARGVIAASPGGHIANNTALVGAELTSTSIHAHRSSCRRVLEVWIRGRAASATWAGSQRITALGAAGEYVVNHS